MEPPRHGRGWLNLGAAAIGGVVGVAQPLFVVGIGAGIYAGPSYAGLLFLGCVAAVVLVVPIATFVSASRSLTVPIVTVSACLAFGMLGGNWLAGTLHVGFAGPRPPTPDVHPLGTGWSATGDLIAGREGHSASLLRDGRVLVAGGRDRHLLSSAELFDPATGAWTATGAMAFALADHTAVLLGDGRVLALDTSGRAQLYEPANGRWTSTKALTPPRIDASVTALADGRVLVAGGLDGSRSEVVPLASATIFDPASGTWGDAGPMAVPRREHTATLLRDGRVLVTGGFGASDPTTGTATTLTSAEIFDPAAGSWTPTDPLEIARAGHGAVLLPGGDVLVVGGVDEDKRAERFDPATETWRFGGSTMVSWKFIALAAGDSAAVLIDFSGVVERYDVRTDSVVAGGYAAHGFGFTATQLADGRILLAGGEVFSSGHALAIADLFDAGGGR